MKKIVLLLILFLSGLNLQAQNQATVDDVVRNVNRTSIMNYIRHLESYGTRFCMAPNRFEIANWIKGEFEGMGFSDVRLDSFQHHANIRLPLETERTDTVTTQVNVVATLRGTETPDEIYVIGGHYDSFCDNADIWTTAPGADDDASGTSCVLESARAIMATGYQPKSTLVFIAFAAEELGYFADIMGSKHHAYQSAARGDDIKLVINNDMIGYNVQHITQATANVAPTDNFTRIEGVLDICNTYGNINYFGEGYAGADLMGYDEMGYDGIYFEENDFMAQINYHKDTDISANIDSLFITEVVKAATAVLISMEDVLSNVEENKELPLTFLLKQNYPNPFNPETIIEYSLAERARVLLEVYNSLGERVALLENSSKSPGKYKHHFSAQSLSSGMYFYRLTAGDYVETKKMIFLK